MNHPHAHECQVVLLTPLGRAAIAVVQVRGSSAARLVADCFRPVAGIAVPQLKLNQIYFGHWQSSPSQPAEELVLTRRSEDRFEVHCHGGAAASAAIVESLLALGAVQVDSDDWLPAAEDDPLRRAAARLLPDAATERMAAILLDQYRGALRSEIEKLLSNLERDEVAATNDQLTKLLEHARLTRHFRQPWRVVLAGPPNVGKSSLINALIGYQRAIVHPTPGTTRDVVTAATAIDGWPVELADTAGLRESSDEIEREGVARARQLLADADLLLLVHDAAQPEQRIKLPPELIVPRLIVSNKIDLLPEEATSQLPGLVVSALLGQGLPELLVAISAQLVPQAPVAGEAVPLTKEQLSKLQAAQSQLHAGQLSAAATALRGLLTDADPECR